MKFLAILSILGLFQTLAYARITSLGLDTAASVRSGLKDEDFRIRPEAGVRIDTPDFRVRVADLTVFPALAGTDTQTQIGTIRLRAGKLFLPHYHPRGTEVLCPIRGVIKVTFTFEGLNPRVVANTIKSGECTVFPQGLIHTTTCTSSIDCRLINFFNTADPGLIPVNL